MTDPADCCGACEGTAPQTPAVIDNRPGLPAIARRAGTQPQFKSTMLAALASLPELRTRADEDFTVGLLDAWAGVADVLTFYQERIANEGYLRTATEQRSLAWLAELVGWFPQPGVAAGTWLAFSMTAAPGAPGSEPGPVTVAARTRVQSMPGPGELPLTFETSDAITARVEWNALRPSLSRPQPVTADMTDLLLAGTATGLKAGDPLVIVPDDAASRPVLRIVQTVTAQPALARTQVSLRSRDAAPPPAPPALRPLVLGVARALETLALQRIRPVALDLDVPRTTPAGWSLLARRATEQAAPFVARAADLAAFGWRWRLEPRTLFASLAAWQPPAAAAVYALRTRASLFGHNAPDPRNLADSVAANYSSERSASGNRDWLPLTDREHPILDTVYPRVAAHRADLPSFAALTWSDSQGPRWLLATVDSANEAAASRCTLAGKATQLALGVVAESDSSALAAAFDDFTQYRGTSVFAETEPLALARLPRSDEPLPADSVLDLDTWVDGLVPGQAIAVTGEPDAARGTVASEVVSLLAVDHVVAAGGYTSLTLAQALTRAYVRDTVAINANVVAATHGASVHEVLGSGDGSAARQRFDLRQSPLTWTSAPTARGVASSLLLRVNGLAWSERDSFLGAGPDDRVFVTRPNDDGSTRVEFGDGVNGARPPSGLENVVADYRKGLGSAGNVEAGRLTLLQVRPLGVQGVTNPVPASGGADADGPEDIRVSAPLGMRTLGRIVSLQDYEDFARAFGGIAKSLATWSWHGQARGVFVTVAGIDGADVPAGGPLQANLLAAMADASVPGVPVRVSAFRRASFTFGATLRTDPARDAAVVLAAAEAAARAAFAFPLRNFGQPVARSEVIALLQAVPGVVAVQVDALRRTDAALFEAGLVPAALRENSVLEAALPLVAEDATLLGAELLLLDPRPLALSSVPAEAPQNGSARR